MPCPRLLFTCTCSLLGLTATFQDVLKVALVLGDAERIRTALREEQRRPAAGGKTKAIASHCPTRFAICHKMCCDIQASEHAFRKLVERDDWPQLAEASTNSNVLEKLKTADWWKKLDQVWGAVGWGGER